MNAELQTKVQASPAQSFTPVQTNLLQRKSALYNTPGLVKHSERDKEKLTLQHSSADQAGTTTVPRFGHDFSRGRVHSTGPGMIQAKLKINEPGDIYEQEADRVAEQVMRMPELPVKRQPKEEEEKKEEEAELIMAKAISGKAPEISDNLQARLNKSKGGGQPLPVETKFFMEERYGVDFSSVRVHTNSNAVQMARDLNAEAFTYGKDIYFGGGRYKSMEHQAGKRLLAHELTHVIQQNYRIDKTVHQEEKRKFGPEMRILPQAVPLVSQVRYSKGSITPNIQLATIPTGAPLVDFVSWTQRAIDDLRPSHPSTLGTEVLAILSGLRGHVTLRDANGSVVTAGGTFSVTSALFAGLPVSVSFELIIDDSSTPPRPGIFTPPSSPGGTATITLFAHEWRGNDHIDLGDTLFHEVVHALFYLRQTYPAIGLRTQAESILSPTAHATFYSAVQREVNSMIPGHPQSASIASRLAEEILVIVETEAYSVSQSGSPPMGQGNFDSSMDRYLFQTGLFLNDADKQAIMADPVRNFARITLLNILYRYYISHRFHRFSQAGRPSTFFAPNVSPRPTRLQWTPPTAPTFP